MCPCHHFTHRSATNLAVLPPPHLSTIEFGDDDDIKCLNKPQHSLPVAFINKVMYSILHPCLSTSHRIALSGRSIGCTRDKFVKHKTQADEFLSIISTYFTTAMSGRIPTR